MSFILWTIWIICICVAVNIVMEKVWNRIEPIRERDEVGSLGRHRSGR